MLVSFLAEVCAIYLLEFCLILKYFIFDFIVPVFGLISVRSVQKGYHLISKSVALPGSISIAQQIQSAVSNTRQVLFYELEFKFLLIAHVLR